MPTLKTEQPTETMRAQVLKAARLRFHARQPGAAHYEHGQWWLIRADGSQWSVVDAEPGQGTTGLDFEEITSPDDDTIR